MPDSRMWRSVCFDAWYTLLLAELGILSGWARLWDLKRLAIRQNSGQREILELSLRRTPTDSS
jgi:hypothetical protein